jgi:hypothetical protein
MNEQQTSAAAPLKQSSRPPVWPALVAALLIVIATVAVVYLVLKDDAAGEEAGGLAGAFAPQINYRTAIYSALTDLKVDPKLVILTLTSDVQVSKSSELKILWGLNLGTTSVEVRAADNKVQYYIALEDLDADDMQYIPDRNVLRITLPQPVLDEQLVDVQSDPDKIELQTQVGWARLDSLSGSYLRQEARKDLRAAVIDQGTRDTAMSKARQAARQVITELLAGSIADKLRSGVQVEVEFEPAP